MGILGEIKRWWRSETEQSDEQTDDSAGEVVAVEPSTRQAEIEHETEDVCTSDDIVAVEWGGENPPDSSSGAIEVTSLADVDNLTDVKGIGETRAASLEAAGFVEPMDLYLAEDSALADVDGIGQYTVEQVRSDIGSQDE